MTAFSKVRSKDHPGLGHPIYPLCGKRRDNLGHNWTPAAIQKHEAGCGKCQQLLDARNARRQSEYRARLNVDPDDQYLEEAPFEE